MTKFLLTRWLFFTFIGFVIFVFFIPICLELLYFYLHVPVLGQIREVAKIVFETKSNFFGFIGAILIGPSITIPLLWQIIRDEKKEVGIKNKLISGLQHEIRKNIQTVYQGEMEDVIETDIYKKAKANLHLMDVEKFNYISNLYRFSRSYQNMIKAWRREDPILCQEKFTKLKLQYAKFLSIQLGFSDFKPKYYDDFRKLTKDMDPTDEIRVRIESSQKIEKISRLMDNIYKNNKDTINTELESFVRGVFF